MNIQPGITVPVAPGPSQRIFPTNVRQGNAGNGGNPNPPTIVPQFPGTFPRVNLNPEFVIGGYNNAEESYHYPRFEEYWNDYYYSNNPVGAAEGPSAGYGGPMGNAGNGSNKTYAFGSGYAPMEWTPYKLEQLGNQGGYSQSYPYNKNQTNLEGGNNRVWDYVWNVNVGDQTEVSAGTALAGAQAFLAAQRMFAEGLERSERINAPTEDFPMDGSGMSIYDAAQARGQAERAARPPAMGQAQMGQPVGGGN